MIEVVLKEWYQSHPVATPIVLCFLVLLIMGCFLKALDRLEKRINKARRMLRNLGPM